MTQAPVRLALLGPGGFGRERARAISASPDTTLVACYSPIPAERETCAHTFGGAAVTSEAAIWDDDRVDGVVICTPNQLHLPQILQAAASGKHVFVEKPIAPTVAAAQEIITACDKAGLVLMVGHNSRRFDRIRTMKAWLEEGTLGQVIAAEAQYSHPGGLSVQPGDWRWFPDNCPGGPLTQLGVHQIDSLQYLLGPVARVSAWQRRLAVAAAIDDVTVTLLEFAGGPLAYVGAHYAVSDLRYMYLLGTTANARWDEATGLLLESEAGREKIPLPDSEAATLLEEIEEFAACIRTGAAPEVGGSEALQAVAVVEAAVLSNERRRPVELAELLG
jgi:predicted dehydrogenase